jgi:hypothetical protein
MDINELIKAVTAQLQLLGIDKVITLILALYGAILSTILAVREWRKETRRIIIFLEYLRPAGDYRIIITNVGHRPITLLDMAVRIPGANLDPSDIWKGNYPFPVTLKDGELITIPLPPFISHHLLRTRGRMYMILRDSENKHYWRYKLLIHDERNGMTRQMG